MTDSPVDLSAQSLAEMVSQEGIEPNPIIGELTRRLLDVTERENRARQALIAIREVVAHPSWERHPAFYHIDDIARKGLA